MLYPIKFHPILKQKIWGGDKLKTLLNKPSEEDKIGESWEISTVGDDISVVSNGELAGRNLVELVEQYKGNLLGKKAYDKFGDQFPLLIKFIDANENLSVQLHPDDELAQKRHNSFGKTEMWYVMQADKDAKLIVGFNKETNKQEYQKHLKEGRIEELLNFEKIEAGDSYFIEAGTIHAIGSGCLIAEIQQTSDVTYRVYDWNRKDEKGIKRELHTELAMDALNYNFNDDYRKEYEEKINLPSQIVSCNYFTTNILRVKGEIYRNYEGLDSFKVYMCIAGEGSLSIDNFIKTPVKKGETILIPAKFNKVDICGRNLELLEIYIK